MRLAGACRVDVRARSCETTKGKREPDSKLKTCQDIWISSLGQLKTLKGSSQNDVIAQCGVGGKIGHSCALGDTVGRRDGQERFGIQGLWVWKLAQRRQGGPLSSP